MAELADALDSGSSEVTFVQVQVLLPAPKKQMETICFFFLPNFKAGRECPEVNKRADDVKSRLFYFGIGNCVSDLHF